MQIHTLFLALSGFLATSSAAIIPSSDAITNTGLMKRDNRSDISIDSNKVVQHEDAKDPKDFELGEIPSNVKEAVDKATKIDNHLMTFISSAVFNTTLFDAEKHDISEQIEETTFVYDDYTLPIEVLVHVGNVQHRFQEMEKTSTRMQALQNKWERLTFWEIRKKQAAMALYEIYEIQVVANSMFLPSGAPDTKIDKFGEKVSEIVQKKNDAVSNFVEYGTRSGLVDEFERVYRGTAESIVLLQRQLST